jgi:hypothetical protein
MRKSLRLIIVMAVALVVAAGASAQPRQPVGNLKVVVAPARAVDSPDGATLYQAYCASCHGKDLKGYGPAGRFTSTQPTDLTTFASDHKTQGARALHVLAAINEAHGVTAFDEAALNMPDWTTVFTAISGDSKAAGALRMVNISNYIASRQQPKPPKTLLAKR